MILKYRKLQIHLNINEYKKKEVVLTCRTTSLSYDNTALIFGMPTLNLLQRLLEVVRYELRFHVFLYIVDQSLLVVHSKDELVRLIRYR